MKDETIEIKISKLNQIIENQQILQSYIKKHNLLFKDDLHRLVSYLKAIQVELSELVLETQFKWWKQKSSIDEDKLFEEFCDIFIFLLDYSLLVNNKDYVKSFITKMEDEDRLAIVYSEIEQANTDNLEGIIDWFNSRSLNKLGHLHNKLRDVLARERNQDNYIKYSNEIILSMLNIWIYSALLITQLRKYTMSDILDMILGKQNINIQRQQGKIKGREDYKAI